MSTLASVAFVTASLKDTVRGVFGQNAVIVRPLDAPTNSRFCAIPGSGGYRWIVPRDPKSGLPAMTSWQPYSRTARLKWQLVIKAYCAGALTRVPGVISFGVVGGDLASDALQPPASDPFSPVIYIGTPGRSQKAVISLVTDRRVRGVMKVPLTEFAKHKIAREVEALQLLGATRPAVAPRLLSFDFVRGRSLQEYCPGLPAPLDFASRYLDWLISLHDPGTEITLASHVERLVPRLESLHPELIVRIAEVLALLNDTTALPAFLGHGDFAPWNLKLNDNGSIRTALDWEDFRPATLPLFDYFHYNVDKAYLFKREVDWGSLLRGCERYSQHFRLDPAVVQKLIAAYLLDSVAARLEEGDRLHAEWDIARLCWFVAKSGMV